MHLWSGAKPQVNDGTKIYDSDTLLRPLITTLLQRCNGFYVFSSYGYQVEGLRIISAFPANGSLILQPGASTDISFSLPPPPEREVLRYWTMTVVEWLECVEKFLRRS